MAIPTREPSQIAAGETLSFVRNLPDYPASDGWTITYSFRGGTGSKMDFSSTASGSDHSITVSADTTATWIPGSYSGIGIVALDGVKYRIWSGSLVITPNLASEEGDFDPRSQARKTLDNINAVIEGRATHDILKSTVEGSTFERLTISDLLLLRDRYSQIVAAEEAKASGLSTRRNILIRFK